MRYTLLVCFIFFFFFFNDTATTEIYTLSLHDALPISGDTPPILLLGARRAAAALGVGVGGVAARTGDRKSTRLNSSHLVISYAVFCLKKKKKKHNIHINLPHCRCRGPYVIDTDCMSAV